MTFDLVDVTVGVHCAADIVNFFRHATGATLMSLPAHYEEPGLVAPRALIRFFA